MANFIVITLSKEDEHQWYRITAESFKAEATNYTFYGSGGIVALFSVATTVGVVDERAWSEDKE
jgi:hypothetical protein